MEDDEEEEEEEEEGEAGGDEDEEDLYESDVSLAEDMDEQEDEPERGRGGAPAFAASGQDAGAWAAQAGGRDARVAPSGRRRTPDEEEEEEEEEGEEASYDDEDEEFDGEDADDALLAAQGLRRRQEAGALTARQRALHEPAGAPYSPPEAAARVGKRKLQDDGPDAALRREAAKAKVRQLKEAQLAQARETATAKILSGDTSRKRQAAKTQKEHEDRLAERRAQRHPQPGFVRIKRGAAGSVLEFAPGERPYWTDGAAAA